MPSDRPWSLADYRVLDYYYHLLYTQIQAGRLDNDSKLQVGKQFVSDD